MDPLFLENAPAALLNHSATASKTRQQNTPAKHASKTHLAALAFISHKSALGTGSLLHQET
jgi:hypothetical protein